MNRIVCIVLLLCASVLPGGEIDPAVAKKRLQEAVAWERQTSLEDYKTFGTRDPRWDADALRLLELYCDCQTMTHAGMSQSFFGAFTAGNAAKEKGGTDAMIVYGQLVGYRFMHQGQPKQLYEMARNASAALQNSRYHIFRKAMAEAVLSEIIETLSEEEMTDAIALEYETAMKRGKKLFMQCCEDKSIPPDRLISLGEVLVNAASSKTDREKALSWLLEGLPKEQRVSAPILSLAAIVYTNFAWDARGYGYADTVTPEGHALMEKRLKIAANCAEQAFAADPYIRNTPKQMMSIELGQGQGRERLNLWYKRGMLINPNDYDLCASYMYYLEPKWYGSDKEMLTFARVVAAEKNWKAGLPLLVEHAHRNLSKYADEGEYEYFKRPGVWEDIKACFDPFLKLYPDAVTQRSQYMRLAAFCGQWKVAREQRAILGSSIHGWVFQGVKEMHMVMDGINHP